MAERQLAFAQQLWKQYLESLYTSSMKEHFGFDDARMSAEFIKNRAVPAAVTLDGVILGSGLGTFVENEFETKEEIPFDMIYKDILRMNDMNHGSPVPGHSRKMVVGRLKGAPQDALTIAQAGREHPYEGVDLKRSTFWIRVMQLLGTRSLIGSNASGVLTPDTLEPPALMVVAGHQDLSGQNPLIGRNNDRFGPRFPHLGDLYTGALRTLLKDKAKALKIPLREGVYFRVTGPNYEQPADVFSMRAALEGIYRTAQYDRGPKTFTGDRVGVVGMSSTYEAIVAKHASQSKDHPAFTEGIGFVSVATNYAAAMGPHGFVAPPTHAEVGENAKKVETAFGTLIREVLLEKQRS